jgi:HAD superfamily hydrolase (TIGR01549 family)
MGQTFSPSTLTAYRGINEALWEEYRRGLIDQATLARERFRRLLERLGADPEGALGLADAYLAELSLRGDLLPGCRTTLARLRRRFRLGLVTNGIDRVQRSRLEAARLQDHFDVVVTSEGCGFTKPDPRILAVALRALKLRPAQAIYVGDDPLTDGRAARAAGMPFYWFDRGKGRPSGVRRPLRSIKALPELLEALG